MSQTLPTDRAVVWATPDAIHASIPVQGSDQPYITRYPRTIEGLAAALNVVIERPERAGARTTTDHPAVNAKQIERTERKRPGNVEQRSKAAKVLAALGITRG
jgi:hypothetical protein